MKNIIKIAVLSMVLINCGSDNNGIDIDNSGSINNDGNINDNSNDTPTTFESQNIDFITISKGYYLYYDEGSEEIQNIVFTNSYEWKSFLGELSNELDCFDPNNEWNCSLEMDIDFTAYQVIATIDIWRPSTGWHIEISTITELEDEIKVTANAEQREGSLLTVMTQPYHVVKIPKIDKTIVFDISFL